MMRRLLGSPFVWCVLLLALAEAAARTGRPYADAPVAADAPRNGWNRRGWPEYVAAPEPAPEPATRSGPLAVLVGNSQALGKELPDPRACHPARLDTRLGERVPGARLENWAAVGLRASELELLSLQAARRGADLFIVALGYENFDAPTTLTLEHGGTDIDLLAGWPALWGPLRETTATGRRVGWDDLLERGVQTGTALGRWRRPLLDALAARLPRPHHRAVFGHPRLRQLPLGVGEDGGPLPAVEVAREAWADSRGRAVALRRLGQLGPADLAPSLASLLEVADALVARAEAAGMALLWVWVPMDTARLPPSMVEVVERFNDRAGRALRERGVPVIDLTRLVPPDEYITLTHFDGRGHARMTRALLPGILDALP